MNVRDEEQLQRFFEHSMSVGEEQNFLIDIAARDDLRLAFRSNLELMKALRADKDASVVSAAIVRSRTLTALGLGGALLPNALKENEVAQSAAMPLSGGSPVMTFLRRPVALLGVGLLAGAAIVYSLVPNGNKIANHSATVVGTSAPSTIIIHAPAPPEPIVEPVMTPTTTASATHVTTKRTTGTTIPIVKKTVSSPIQVQTNVHKGEPAK